MFASTSPYPDPRSTRVRQVLYLTETVLASVVQMIVFDAHRLASHNANLAGLRMKTCTAVQRVQAGLPNQAP